MNTYVTSKLASSARSFSTQTFSPDVQRQQVEPFRHAVAGQQLRKRANLNIDPPPLLAPVASCRP